MQCYTKIALKLSKTQPQVPLIGVPGFEAEHEIKLTQFLIKINIRK